MGVVRLNVYSYGLICGEGLGGGGGGGGICWTIEGRLVLIFLLLLSWLCVNKCEHL